MALPLGPSAPKALLQPLELPGREVQRGGALAIADPTGHGGRHESCPGNSLRLIVKVSIGRRHFHSAVTPRHF